MHPKTTLIAPLILGLTLAACATPREQCEADAGRHVKALEQAIETSEENIARGYALRTEVKPYRRFGLCLGDNDVLSCYRTDYITRETPVAIDLAVERRKLASARARLAEERRKARTALAQCARQYSAEG
jgi:hypothetical protein